MLWKGSVGRKNRKNGGREKKLKKERDERGMFGEKR